MRATSSTKIGGVSTQAISPVVPILQKVKASRSYFWAGQRRALDQAGFSM